MTTAGRIAAVYGGAGRHERRSLGGMRPDPYAVFRSAPNRAGLFLDFDGTLADIVADPAAARPAEGVAPLLSELTALLAVVAVVSGRSARQLVDWLGPEVEIWGLHGAERTAGGEVFLSEVAQEYVPLMRRVLAEARSMSISEGVVVEDKDAIVALHYRQARDRSAAVREVERIAGDLARRHGLTVGHGRLVMELRPPVAFSKADVVLRRARELQLQSVVFAGDDLVDLPAFDALDELARSEVETVRVAVASDEAPQELLARADVVVERPAGLVRWLRGLLP